MGHYVFNLPDVGEGVAEAEIVAWHVKIGDNVKEDQPIIDVMTDKATVEMTSPVDGIVTALHGEMGELLPVGSALVEFMVQDSGNVENQPVITPPTPPATKASDKMTPPQMTNIKTPQQVPPPLSTPAKPAFTTREANDAPLAAPSTRRRAHELGIGLQYVCGTGPAGRITPENLDAYILSGGEASGNDTRYAIKTSVHDIPIIGLRRKIARKMQDAKRRIPHITYVEEFDLTELETLRKELNACRMESQPKLTLLPFFMLSLVRTLPEFPQINSRYDDDNDVLHSYDGIHIGMATQTPAGLMVPVVRHAESLNIWAYANEITRLANATRDGSIKREEMSGSTITLTSLGTLGGIVTTPVINHPEVAIIAPNKLVDRPIFKDGGVTIRKIMNVSSSFDHRIVDGYDAAKFIQKIKRIMEHPALLFMA